MALILKGYTFGADICDGCGKKNRYWNTRNFHNKKCAAKFIRKMNKFYDTVRIEGNENISA